MPVNSQNWQTCLNLSNPAYLRHYILCIFESVFCLSEAVTKGHLPLTWPEVSQFYRITPGDSQGILITEIVLPVLKSVLIGFSHNVGADFSKTVFYLQLLI